MNSPENNPGSQSLESSRTSVHSANYVYDMLDEVFADDIVDSVAMMELRPGFIAEREEDFKDASCVTYIRNRDNFLAIFEFTNHVDYYQQNVYTIDNNDITKMIDGNHYGPAEIAIINGYNSVHAEWIDRLSSKDTHALYFHDEQARLRADLETYEELKTRELALLDAKNDLSKASDDISGSDGPWIQSRIDEIKHNINKLHTRSQSTLGTPYEQSYWRMLASSMEIADQLRILRADANARILKQLERSDHYSGEPINGYEASSLIRVIEATKCLKSKREL